MPFISNANDVIDDNSFNFESYGVRIGVRTDRRKFADQIRDRLKFALPGQFRLIGDERVQHVFRIELSEKDLFKLFENGEEISAVTTESNFFNYLESKIRLTVAEHADSRVFLHAGVVGWKGKTLIFPASSFRGKTTLVKELILCGAEYFSDEYAVLDETGVVHPFPKTLSIRGIKGAYEQVEFPVESFGGIPAGKPLPVGMVMFTEFSENAVWDPKILKSGEGVLDLIAHCLPIRSRPEFTLGVLNKVATHAIICKSPRGDAEKFARIILEFFETKT